MNTHTTECRECRCQLVCWNCTAKLPDAVTGKRVLQKATFADSVPVDKTVNLQSINDFLKNKKAQEE